MAARRRGALGFCTDRAGGAARTISRARVQVADELSSSIEARLGRSEARQIELGDLRRSEHPSAKARADGFARATLDAADPVFKGPGSVRLAAGGQPLLLAGFDESLARRSVPPRSCKVLEVCEALPAPPPPPLGLKGR